MPYRLPAVRPGSRHAPGCVILPAKPAARNPFEPDMPTLFLSYRQSDTLGQTGRLADALEARYGRDAVFRDIDSIEAGQRFEEVIERALAGCKVFLPLIGDDWLTVRGADGRRRLDDPRDFVRREVVAALARGIPVIPLLLEGARVPAATELPPELRPLLDHQALELSETRWDFDVGRLVEAIDRQLARTTGSTAAASTAGGRRAPVTRRLLWVGLAALVLAAGAGTAWQLARRAPQLPSVEGVWMLPSGSFWTVQQDGRRLKVEETHYLSGEVWRRGTGTVLEDGSLEIELLPVFDPPERLRLALRLRPGPDGRSLSGESHDLVSGRRESLTLLRR
jgi:hypothetical protein